MELTDKIKGAIVGMAYGDSLGVGTTFMTREEVESYYPEGLRSYSQIIRDAHRSQWRRGEWTNETALTTLMLECVMESGGFYPQEMCSKFITWYSQEARDIPPLLRLYCKTPEWPKNPIATAHKIWHSSGVAEASNETLHRSLVTGLTSERSQLDDQTRRFVLMTHDDSRCVTSTMILARVIRGALTGEEAGIDELRNISMQFDSRVLPYLEKAWEGDIERLDISDPSTQSWTRKGMASALWGYWHHNEAESTIHSVIDLGGDADTNAAMAGALAGIKYGFEALPAEKEKIVGYDSLLDLSERVAEYVDKKQIWRK